MPDMTNYQYLINPHFNCEHDIAKKGLFRCGWGY
ncbi:hypothetical protein T2313_2046 [Escherichia coli]|nr:hypothetical protein T2313_2046 [Escherichia coli]